MTGKNGLKVARLDAAANSEVRRQFNVQIYPTVRYFPKGYDAQKLRGGDYGVEFGEERSRATVDAFAASQVGVAAFKGKKALLRRVKQSALKSQGCPALP
jgi:hypothetical protein